jgi:protein-S-isoprenylcysteine O-methyltransferase Ste14
MYFAMVPNSLAAIGFLLLFAADFLLVRGKKSAGAIGRTGYTAVAAAIGAFAFAPSSQRILAAPITPTPAPHAETGPQSAFLTILLVVVAAISCTLLLWSVFFELEIEKRKHGLGPRDTVRSGSYGFCRHPGFWWFSVLVALIGFSRGISSSFMTVFIMISLDLLLILVQDRYTFPKVFRGYDDYKKAVPFLIPHKGIRRADGA